MAALAVAAAVAVVAAGALAGCGAAREPGAAGRQATSGDQTTSGHQTTSGDQATSVLPTGARVDYQLGGAYPPAAGVTGVVRDRTDSPTDGWSACYVNAFQTQPGSTDWPEDVLLHDGGHRVEDPDWPGEYLLDVSTAARRTRVLAVVGPWIDRCAADGFDAVEPDNLDSWTRSHGALDEADAAATARLLVARAHAAGLVIGQKNAPELAGHQLGFDYAVTEDCGRYDECATFTDAYATVLDVEYGDAGFRRACAVPGLHVQRRDLAVSTPGTPGYVAAWCPAS